MKKKKLVILGSGPSQVSGIVTAVECGHHVVTVDWDLENPGHKFSHESYCLDTSDVEGISKLVKEIGADGICTFASDLASVSVSHVSENTGLAGVPSNICSLISNKNRFREFQKRESLPHPEFTCVGMEWSGLIPEELGDLLVVKPIDSSGSKGVAILPRDHVKLNEAIMFAISKIDSLDFFISS